MGRKNKDKKAGTVVEAEDALDGAWYHQQDKMPHEFMTGTDGLRPNETKEPNGTTIVDLRNGISGRTIPPRFIWDEGDWEDLSDPKKPGWYTWVVSGEGTPGNWETRKYQVPDDVAKTLKPDHPADWSVKNQRPTAGNGGFGSSKGGTGLLGSGSSSSSSAGLPWGLLIRCPGCGHFFKVNGMSDHAKGACPATQDPVMWVVPCECHEDILDTIEVFDGFPIKPQDVVQTVPGAASGANDGEEDADESGGGAEPESKASSAT